MANTTPAPGVVQGIASLMTLTPAGAAIIAAVIFHFGYKMEDKQVVQMQEEITFRKEPARA